MASSTGKGAANNATASTKDGPRRGVLPAGATRADRLNLAAYEAEQALAAAEAKCDKQAGHLADAERAVTAAKRTADAARRAADRASD